MQQLLDRRVRVAALVGHFERERFQTLARAVRFERAREQTLPQQFEHAPARDRAAPPVRARRTTAETLGSFRRPRPALRCPWLSVATVLTIGGDHMSGRCARLSSASSSFSVLNTPSRSALLMTKTSPISMMPALMAWMSSPMPGTSTTTDTSAVFTISTSSCPTPTVSTMTFCVAGGVENRHGVHGRAREPAEVPARRHRADEDAGVEPERLHAYAVAEDGAARERARRVNGDDADALAARAVEPGELVHERRLPRPGRARDADDEAAPRVREDGLHQTGRVVRAVLDLRDGARDGARVARQNPVDGLRAAHRRDS